VVAALGFLEAKADYYYRHGYQPEVAWGSLAAWNALLGAPLPETVVTELFAERFDRRGGLPYLASFRRQREREARP
jgi:hypothetical protein